MREEQFVERGTPYQLKNASLMVYETNVPCRGIEFTFPRFMFTLMLSGHKTVTSDNLRFEFFPGTLFIPEPHCPNVVDIPNASMVNPTKCLVLDVDPAFIRTWLSELALSGAAAKLPTSRQQEDGNNFFYSNESGMVTAFTRLYDHVREPALPGADAVTNIMLKELLTRCYFLGGMRFLNSNGTESGSGGAVEQCIQYIRMHLRRKIAISELTEVAQTGKSTLFRKFRDATGVTPAVFIQRERIALSKRIIERTANLKEAAFGSGFSSYGYFCTTFQQVEQMRPSEYLEQMR